MAHIVIDGYNLTGLQHRDLDAERKRLIETLSAYGRRRGHVITVVFDGWRSGPGRESREVKGGVEVIYSGLGELADSVIKRLLERKDRRWIVVSSDREVQRFAWAAGAVPVFSEEFLNALEGRTPAESDNYYEGDDKEDDYVQYPKKGSPRQASKKDRERGRALRKL